jgi:diguanylate cyclase (GGDEF)-like protein
VAGLGVALLGLMALVVGIGALAMSSTRDEVGHVARDGRAITQLGQFGASTAAMQLALEQAHATPDTAARQPLLLAWDNATLTVIGLQRDATEDAATSAALEPVLGDLQEWLLASYTARNALGAAADPALVDISTVRERYAALTAGFGERLQQYGPALTVRADGAVHDAARTQQILLVAGLIGLVIGMFVSRSSYRTARAQHREITRRDRARGVELKRSEDEARVNRGLEYSRNEADARQVVRLALEELVPDRRTELLLADSSRAHFEVASRTHQDEDWPGCPVPTPADCPAVGKGQTLVFDTSEHFDACPFLKDRPGGPRSATCIPVSINGMADGVLHSVAPPGTVVAPEQRDVLELLGARAGDRIGVLRAFSRSESQAATDALTGLANRRNFEERLNGLLRQSRSLAIGFGDLDHFKQLNDSHGHDAGDRALRAFARVLRDAVRPGDLVARWGGEEFVVVFPDTALEEAVQALERVRSELARVVAAGGVPPFTVSFGVADLFDGDDVPALVAAADRALLAAKQAGRDRVVSAHAVRPRREADAGVDLGPG